MREGCRAFAEPCLPLRPGHVQLEHDMWQRVRFDTPCRGLLWDVCEWDVHLGTWRSRDGWIWPLWVPVVDVRRADQLIFLEGF